MIINPTENLDSLRSQAEELESKLGQFEDALVGLEHLQHGPQFLREQLVAAAAFQRAGETRREEICYLKAGLAFELLETQILTYR